jgi:Putative prokaryotic signal transducing protein
MTNDPHRDRVVVVHTAGTATEAVVIRGLLESSGISSPGSVSSDPFPMREAPEGLHGPEILVLESHAAEARRIIAEYKKGNAGSSAQGGDEETSG